MRSNKLTNAVLIEYKSHVPDFVPCCHLGARLTALFCVRASEHHFGVCLGTEGKMIAERVKSKLNANTTGGKGCFQCFIAA